MKRNLFLGLIFTTILGGANALVYGQTTAKAKQNSTATVAAKKSVDKDKKLAEKQRKETMKSENMMEKQQMKDKQTAISSKNTTKKKRKKFLGIF